MAHLEKTYRATFTGAQTDACRIRRRLEAGVLGADEAVEELIEILYGEDYVASTVAAHVLGELGSAAALLPLIETVFHVDPENRYFNRRLRCAALDALRRLAPQDDMVLRTFLAASRDPDLAIAAAARAALYDHRIAARPAPS